VSALSLDISVLFLALFLILTFAACGASVALSWVHLASVHDAVLGETPALVIALKRLPRQERLDALAQRTPLTSWEHRWALDLAACPSGDAKVAVTNERLADIAHTLSKGSRWPASGARISALSSLLLAALSLLAGGGSLVLGGIFAVGIGAAITCSAIGLRAKKAAVSQRQAVDALIDAVLGRALCVPDEFASSAQASPPGRSSHRAPRHGLRGG
jgi:hypothetical protein